LRVRHLLSRRKNPVELCRGLRVHFGGGGVRVLAAEELTAKSARHEEKHFSFHFVPLCLGG
jgi:hypothetical protein